ncbi:hypothetical protein HAL1_18091 [Halomonas sp. HAL1]|nr:hypothetical protein HAL1_18091 [Halomonas sp. HAL1]
MLSAGATRFSFSIKKKHSVIRGLGLFISLRLRLASTPTENLSFFQLAAYATTSSAQVFQALGIEKTTLRFKFL